MGFPITRLGAERMPHSITMHSLSSWLQSASLISPSEQLRTTPHLHLPYTPHLHLHYPCPANSALTSRRQHLTPISLHSSFFLSLGVTFVIIISTHDVKARLNEPTIIVSPPACFFVSRNARGNLLMFVWHQSLTSIMVNYYEHPRLVNLKTKHNRAQYTTE